ncbi:MAG: hypothetical protein K2N06_00850 [Oscillospiraceae bacterium]|nr:hypothetical protein [Oscillospiraceae bacterium]
MKSEEIFEMFNDIDDSFVDAAFPNEEKSEVVQPQEIHMTKRHLPWGIAAAAAACLAVCAAVGAVIAVNIGKGKIPVVPNGPTQSSLNTIAAEEIYPGYTDSELPLTFTIEELGILQYFQIRNDKTIMRLSTFDMNIDGWGVFSNKVYVRSVYLCDLNFDGYREIAAAVTNESGEKSVRVADVRNQKEYEYKVEGYESRWHYDSLVLKDKKLYLCTADGSHVSKETLSFDDLELVVDKIVEPVVTDQKIESAENDKVRLSVGIPKSEYKKGEIIDLTAEVYNKSDKTFYIVSPTSTREAHLDIKTVISLGENKLVDMDEVQFGNDMMEYIPVNPGELYTVVRRFDTSNAEVGVYGVFSTVIVTDGFNADVTEDVTVKFQIEITSGASDEPATDPVTPDDPSESTEPEPLSSVFENDKLRLQVDLEKYAYKKGDIITVDAEVTNKSDKKFYIFVPTATADTHTEIRTNISLDDRKLNDIDAVRYWDDAIKLIPLEPGESFTLKKVRFDTTYTGDELLGISNQPVQSGIYQGITTVTILDSPGFETPAESYYTSFAISIM